MGYKGINHNYKEKWRKKVKYVSYGIILTFSIFIITLIIFIITSDLCVGVIAILSIFANYIFTYFYLKNAKYQVNYEDELLFKDKSHLLENKFDIQRQYLKNQISNEEYMYKVELIDNAIIRKEFMLAENKLKGLNNFDIRKDKLNILKKLYKNNEINENSFKLYYNKIIKD